MPYDERGSKSLENLNYVFYGGPLEVFKFDDLKGIVQKKPKIQNPNHSGSNFKFISLFLKQKVQRT
jgi:hypothetical protein